MTVTVDTLVPTDRSEVYEGDCTQLIPLLPDESIDIVVTSPPYWGQRKSVGSGTESDPRDYLAFLKDVFLAIHPKLKRRGIVWVNMGDAYNTPVKWTEKDYKYSTLGTNQNGFSPDNAAYTKPRFKREAFIEKRKLQNSRAGDRASDSARPVTIIVSGRSSSWGGSSTAVGLGLGVDVTRAAPHRRGHHNSLWEQRRSHRVQGFKDHL